MIRRLKRATKRTAKAKARVAFGVWAERFRLHGWPVAPTSRAERHAVLSW